MLLDYPSLLVAIGFSAVCLSALLFTAWMTARADRYLLTCAIGALLVVCHAFTYAAYANDPQPVLLSIGFGFLLVALGVLYGAARQFRTGRPPWPHAVSVAAISLAIVLPPISGGYDGISAILFNAAAATIIALIAREYWPARQEAPVAIAGLCGFYLFIGSTFVLCGAVLVLEGRLVLDGAPSNWAEHLNVISAVIGIPGVGAMTMILNQSRMTQLHKRDAMTDPLTGLFNRRALFDMVGAMAMGREIAVILFDIDRFKAINDARGHATGDRVIALFARALRQHLGKGQLAARLGGEEFALVLGDTGPQTALAHAEAVRTSFAQLAMAELGMACTASAGVAHGQATGRDFEATLNAADQMLYKAKRGGRDRTALAGQDAGEAGMITRPSSSRP